MWRFWYIRGYHSEGRAQLVAALAGGPGREDLRAIRAKVLNGAGNMAWQQGDYAAARTLHEESLAIRRELGDQRSIAASLGNLGNVAHVLGDYAAARTLHEESLAIRRELGRSYDGLSVEHSTDPNGVSMFRLAERRLGWVLSVLRGPGVPA